MAYEIFFEKSVLKALKKLPNSIVRTSPDLKGVKSLKVVMNCTESDVAITE